MSEVRTEREMTREAVADYLRSFADQLAEETTNEERNPTRARAERTIPPDEDGTEFDREQEGRPTDSEGRITFRVDNESATVTPPDSVSFTIEVGNDSSIVGEGTEHVSFDLAWPSSEVDADHQLEIL